jgi:hypothetical protein
MAGHCKVPLIRLVIHTAAAAEAELAHEGRTISLVKQPTQRILNGKQFKRMH